jgi:ubiquinol-cytochrome c reductase iron-sulfur subunit
VGGRERSRESSGRGSSLFVEQTMTDIPSKVPTDPISPDHRRTRRDFLYVATAAVGTVGVAAAIVPVIAPLEPDKATLAAGGPVELDLTQVQAGQQVIVHWRDHPIFVINRTAAALKTLQSPKLIERLADPRSGEFQQPKYAQNWHRSANPNYGVFVGICTHLGCIPLYYPDPSANEPVADWLGGYFCPCHGSKYDLAGRVFSGVPAPYNLPVPPYRFVNDHMIRIGENPPNSHFDFASIRQI